MRRALKRTTAILAIVTPPLLCAAACGPAALSLGDLGDDAGDASDASIDVDEDASDGFVFPDTGFDTAAQCTTTFTAANVDIGWVRAPSCLLCLRTTCCENAGRCFDTNAEDATPTCEKYGECLDQCHRDAGDGGDAGACSACDAFREGGLGGWTDLTRCAQNDCDACSIE